MAFVLLDPDLFAPTQSTQDFEERLVTTASILRHPLLRGAVIPTGTSSVSYWSTLYRTRLRGAPRTTTASVALREITSRATGSLTDPPPSATGISGRLYAVNALYPAGHAFEREMAAMIGAAVAARQETFLVVERNIVRHGTAGQPGLSERWPWRVFAAVAGAPPMSVPCIHHPRNIDTRWSTKYDLRLPSASDGGRCPFCPPHAWARAKTQAWRAAHGRPCCRELLVEALEDVGEPVELGLGLSAAARDGHGLDLAASSSGSCDSAVACFSHR
jgi:hypothetical protein